MPNTSRPKTRLARRKPDTVTDLELGANQLLLGDDAINTRIACIPSWKPILPEIESTLRGIKILLQGDLNIRDSNMRTALHEAAYANSNAVVEYLVLRGADIHALDDCGATPLDVAYRFGDRDLIAAMLGKSKETLTRPFEEEDGNSDCVRLKLKKREWFKRGAAALNVGIELCLVVASQEKGALYRRLGVALSFVCMALSVMEVVCEGRKGRVEWKKRGWCYWFYYPGREGRPFGAVLLWFGVLSSMVQLWISVTSLVVKRTVVKFDYMGLLLSVCYLLAQFGGRKSLTHGS